MARVLARSRSRGAPGRVDTLVIADRFSCGSGALAPYEVGGDGDDVSATGGSQGAGDMFPGSTRLAAPTDAAPPSPSASASHPRPTPTPSTKSSPSPTEHSSPPKPTAATAPSAPWTSTSIPRSMNPNQLREVVDGTHRPTSLAMWRVRAFRRSSSSRSGLWRRLVRR